MAFVQSTATVISPLQKSVVGNDESQTQVFEQTHSVISVRSVSACTRRNEMMMEALLQLQVGNIDSALALVANAFSLFESEINSFNRGRAWESSRRQWDYLPALLFITCLRCVIDDHVALHQHIPTCLSMSCSRALSSTTMELRTHFMQVLKVINEINETNTTDVVSEWDDLVSRASLRGNVDHHQQQSVITAGTTSSAEQSWSCMYFVALWMLYCHSDNPPKAHGSSASHIFGEMSSSHDVGTSAVVELTCSVGLIRWCTSSVTSLGICYDHGVGGVEKDIHKAVSLYQRAADAGSGTAIFNLAVCYDNGDGVENDIHKAVILYRRAADAGNTMAMFNLAVCYENGVGVDQDLSEAVKLYQRAADAGNVEATGNLGYCYKNGNGVDLDASKAVTLYQRAADAGNANAMNNLAACYRHGDGVEKDPHKAVALYQRAVDLGNAAAMCNLGVCYYNGDVEKDTHKAVTMYQRAADAGESQALSNLAWRYYNGTDGFSKDVHQAMRLWLRASNLGHVGATAQLRFLQSKSNT